jgi:thiamine-phosphate pyrophosphorylase
LLVTDRRQARWPLVEVVARAITGGCRWVSVREKDLSEGEQIALVRTLLPIAWRHGACVSLHGEAVLAKAAKADGVHLSARSNPIVARELLGADKLIGVSIHTVTEAEAIDPGVVDYAIAGPAFETASKPRYGPEIGRKGLAGDARGRGACGRSGWHSGDGRRDERGRSAAGDEIPTRDGRRRTALMVVRFGSKADIGARWDHVRFTPKSGH